MWIDWAKMYNKGKEVVKLHGSAAREKEKPKNWLNCCFLRAKYSDGIWKLTSCVWNNTCWICARDLKAMRAIKTHTHKRTTTAFSIPLTHIYFTRLDNISLMVQSEGGAMLSSYWFLIHVHSIRIKREKTPLHGQTMPNESGNNSFAVQTVFLSPSIISTVFHILFLGAVNSQCVCSALFVSYNFIA